MRINKDKILLVMAKKGLNQNALAVKAKMSRGNLSTIINGKNCKPETVVRLARALEVNEVEIIEN